MRALQHGSRVRLAPRNVRPLARPAKRARGEGLGMALKKILIVDDEEDVRLFLRDFLSDRDFAVETASGGQEALEKFAGFKPDLILLDIMMPGMDGMEC